MPPQPSQEIREFLSRHNACPQAGEWAVAFRTLDELWQNCKHPEWMLWALEQVEYRNQHKLRLFACECARRYWQLLDDERSKKAVETAERFAQDRATRDELALAWTHARAAASDATRKANWSMSRAAARVVAWDAAKAAAAAAARDASKNGIKAAAWMAAEEQAATAEEAWQSGKLREIVAEDLPGLLRKAKLTLDDR